MTIRNKQDIGAFIDNVLQANKKFYGDDFNTDAMSVLIQKHKTAMENTLFSTINRLHNRNGENVTIEDVLRALCDERNSIEASINKDKDNALFYAIVSLNHYIELEVE